MWQLFWPYALGVSIALVPLGGLLFWEWSCDNSGWASEFRACDFWTKESLHYHENPN